MKHIRIESSGNIDYQAARALAAIQASHDGEMEEPVLLAWHDRPHGRMSPAIAGADLDSRWRDEADITAQPLEDPVLADLAVTEDHWIVDARVGVVDIPLRETTMGVSVWAKNLLDEDDIIDFGPEVINQTGQFINERTVGVDFSISL